MSHQYYYHKLKPSIAEWVEQQGSDYEFLLHPDLLVPTWSHYREYTSFLPAFTKDPFSNNSSPIKIPLRYLDTDHEPTTDIPEPITYYHSGRDRNVTINFENGWSDGGSDLGDYALYDVSLESYMMEYLKVDQSLVSNPTSESDTTRWSEPRTVRIDFHSNYIKEQIRTRYAFLHRPSSGVLNPVVDTYFPQMYYNFGHNVGLKRNHQLPTTAVAISPLIANAFNIKQLSCEQMCQVLGFDKKSIRKLITDVKRHKYTFAFIGAGGTSINTAHWFSEMCKMVNISNIFERVYCFEEDTAEVSNLLRFPIDPRTILSASSSKLKLMAPIVANLSSNFSGISRYVPDTYGRYPYELYTYSSAGEQRVRNKHILYGAPTIETRDDLSKYGNFICATHANTNCSIWLNPKQELENSVESYGMIQLAPFFMNQLRMAIKTLELLAPGDLDLQQQDVQLFNYQFDGTIVGKPDRTYNWQIEQDSLVATEETAILGGN